MPDIDQVLPPALIGVAASLQLELLETGDPAKVYEADLRRAVRQHLNRQLPNGWSAGAEVSIGNDVVRGAGPTDIAVTHENTYPAALELKWWADPSNRIDDALWDAIKMATFVRDGLVDAGYLIAAGRASTWAGNNPLLPFWGGGEWSLDEIQQTKPYYRTVFGESKGPLVLPSALRTEPTGKPIPIHTVEEDWSLRCCRVWPDR